MNLILLRIVIYRFLIKKRIVLLLMIYAYTVCVTYIMYGTAIHSCPKGDTHTAIGIQVRGREEIMTKVFWENNECEDIWENGECEYETG